MAGPSSNVLVNVQGYVTDYALPILKNSLVITRTSDTNYENWESAEAAGTRGPAFRWKKPTRLTVTDGLAFDASTSGSYQEQEMSVSITEEKKAEYAITAFQQATFNPQSVLKTNGIVAINELANTMELFSAKTVSFGGYRFYGSPLVQTNQLLSVGEMMIDVLAPFRSFGGQQHAWVVLPPVPAAQIIQSGLQQFVPDRNDKLGNAGIISQLRGASAVTFLESNLLPTHTAGTASTNVLNDTTGYTISAVTPVPPSSAFPVGVTTIDLTGLTDGETFLENDMIDIGVNVKATNPLKFLTYTGAGISAQDVQGRITTDITVVGGIATITIEPALISTAPDDNLNLNRAIVPGTDTLRVTKSHLCGAVYFGSYFKFAAPPLGSTQPYMSASVREPDVGVAIRAYHGYLPEKAQYFFGHDAVYGAGVAAEGLGRLIFPLS